MKKQIYKSIFKSFIISTLIIGAVLYISEKKDILFSNEVSQQILPAATYTPISGVGDGYFFEASNSSLADVINLILNWGIAFTLILAVLMIIISGIQYILSDVVTSKQNAKTKIVSALSGVIIALLSYVVLQTIDQDLVKINLNFSNLGSETGGGGGGAVGRATNPSIVNTNAVAPATADISDEFNGFYNDGSDANPNFEYNVDLENINYTDDFINSANVPSGNFTFD